MEVYALSGPSGTGKSDSSLLFAHNNDIPIIIDDGLLIHKGRKVAGTSAKYETNYITAVKRATFYFNDHRDEVKRTIDAFQPKKILLIGTSKKMVHYIASKLNLGDINHHIDITSVRTPLEIKMALFVRKTEGKHIVPIPSFQIEQSFFKKLITRGTVVFSKNKMIGEKTIVQPSFQKGSIIISPIVFKKVITHKVQSFTEVENYSNVKISLDSLPYVKLQLAIKLSKHENLIDVIKKIQREIKQEFFHSLNLELYAIDIHIAGVSLHSEKSIP